MNPSKHVKKMRIRANALLEKDNFVLVNSILSEIGRLEFPNIREIYKFNPDVVENYSSLLLNGMDEKINETKELKKRLSRHVNNMGFGDVTPGKLNYYHHGILLPGDEGYLNKFETLDLFYLLHDFGDINAKKTKLTHGEMTPWGYTWIEFDTVKEYLKNKRSWVIETINPLNREKT
ncbi:MAG: hypothetical protein ABIF08_02130 [Nanoarchaeota archaeon]